MASRFLTWRSLPLAVQLLRVRLYTKQTLDWSQTHSQSLPTLPILVLEKVTRRSPNQAFALDQPHNVCKFQSMRLRRLERRAEVNQIFLPLNYLGLILPQV